MSLAELSQALRNEYGDAVYFCMDCMATILKLELTGSDDMLLAAHLSRWMHFDEDTSGD